MKCVTRPLWQGVTVRGQVALLPRSEGASTPSAQWEADLATLASLGFPPP